jgi:TRAP-type C4-dicarboxylate transport system substrate-binding protein
MIRKLSAALVAATVLSAGLASADKPEKKGNACEGVKHCIRFATLAPAKSPWGKHFTMWKEAAEQVSNKGEPNNLRVIWHWNGVEGPEPNVVGKIKSGQLDGAAVTAVGLATIHEPINALQMPGLFESWADLYKARDELRPEFDEKLKAAGFYVSGWGDVGAAHTMSKGFAVHSPKDLAGAKPAFLSGDKIAPKVYETINSFLGEQKAPALTPTPVEVMEILPKLNAKAINVLTTPALAAEQLQWTSRFDNINTQTVSYGVGAMVISQASLDKLPADMKDSMQSLGKKTSALLAAKIRGEDDLAFERTKKIMGANTYTPTAAEVGEFKKLWKAACVRATTALAGGEILKRVKPDHCKK